MVQPIGLVRESQSPAILASVGSTGVEFALPAHRRGEVHAIERVEASECPTFTDALMHFARRHGLVLRECSLFMSIAGAVKGATFRPTNGRWFITLSGLRAVTAGEPMIVNDVAEINIDAALVAVRGGGSAAAGDTVELQNGCACCSSAEELIQSVEKLMALAETSGVPWDHVVVEA